jgi:hypothetical protein
MATMELNQGAPMKKSNETRLPDGTSAYHESPPFH